MQQNFEPLAGCAQAVPRASGRRAGLGKVLGGVLRCALFFALVQALDAAPTDTQRVTLLWDSNPISDRVTGYRIYFGTTSGSYSAYVSVGNVTGGSVTGLEAGLTYYLAVTAYDLNGLESDYSDEIIYTPPLPKMQTRLAPDGQVVLRLQGLPGHLYFLEASEDLLGWTVIDIVFLPSGQAVEFSDPEAASYAKRFYRLVDVSE